jgi:putative endonuclease
VAIQREAQIHSCQASKSAGAYQLPLGAFLKPMKQPCVYIMANKKNGTLYVGVTSNLATRVWQHKNDVVEGFSQRYGTHDLMWYEVHENMPSAIAREKQLKAGSRQRKVDLIVAMNPQWRDLYAEVVS